MIVKKKSVSEGLESLERRTLFALLGVAPDLPLSVYNSTGILNYNAANETFDVTATPLLFLRDGSSPIVSVDGTPTLEMHVKV
ncbi:MAG: hypothetical protein ACREJC_18080, partial [Tepidisphaeraceae bacterium]